MIYVILIEDDYIIKVKGGIEVVEASSRMEQNRSVIGNLKYWLDWLRETATRRSFWQQVRNALTGIDSSKFVNRKKNESKFVATENKPLSLRQQSWQDFFEHLQRLIIQEKRHITEQAVNPRSEGFIALRTNRIKANKRIEDLRSQISQAEDQRTQQKLSLQQLEELNQGLAALKMKLGEAKLVKKRLYPPTNYLRTLVRCKQAMKACFRGNFFDESQLKDSYGGLYPIIFGLKSEFELTDTEKRGVSTNQVSATANKFDPSFLERKKGSARQPRLQDILEPSELTTSSGAAPPKSLRPKLKPRPAPAAS
ncbi:MAG: hypothetical protein GF390_02605 [Candidatus Pacebacteria bacterium]|nr:hypothetical protein [Candidatus Paceibacterota bacterium]